MADRPILFSGPMVRAILDGRKTQTRRVMNPQPNMLNGGVPMNDGRGAYSTEDGWKRYPFAVGDRLYLRETFSGLHEYEVEKWPPSAWFTGDPIWYWADGNPADGDWTKPKPGIHMPRWASRLTLAVTGVRVQRLQEITWEDAEAEGVWYSSQEYREQVCIWRDAPSALRRLRVEHFAKLWDGLNAARGYGWDANPWVVAISFETHHANIDAMPAREAA